MEQEKMIPSKTTITTAQRFEIKVCTEMMEKDWQPSKHGVLDSTEKFKNKDGHCSVKYAMHKLKTEEKKFEEKKKEIYIKSTTQDRYFKIIITKTQVNVYAPIKWSHTEIDNVICDIQPKHALQQLKEDVLLCKEGKKLELRKGAQECVENYFGSKKQAELQQQGLNYWYEMMWKHVKDRDHLLIGLLFLDQEKGNDHLALYITGENKSIQLEIGKVVSCLLEKNSEELLTRLKKIKSSMNRKMTFIQDEPVLATWTDGHQYKAKIVCKTEKGYKVNYYEFDTEEDLEKPKIQKGHQKHNSDFNIS